MSQDKTVPEPSMEEILSSIRRIIADDDQDPADGPAAAADGSDVDVLELTKAAEDEPVSAAPAPDTAKPASLAAPPPQPDVGKAPARAAPEPVAPAAAVQPPAAAATEPAAAAEDDASIVSAVAAAASMSALAKLARPATEAPVPGGSGPTVEALVIQLLRPALREWLDQNLPPLVERIVEQEVRKLARRAELS